MYVYTVYVVAAIDAVLKGFITLALIVKLVAAVQPEVQTAVHEIVSTTVESEGKAV